MKAQLKQIKLGSDSLLPHKRPLPQGDDYRDVVGRDTQEQLPRVGVRESE